MSEFDINLEQDYKELENKFKSILEGTGSFVTEHPELADQLDTFISEVGISVKDLLQKYGKLDYIQKMEVEDYKEQMQEMKHTIVKMRLKVKQVGNACKAFENISKVV